MTAILFYIYLYRGNLYIYIYIYIYIFLSKTRMPWPLISGYIASSSSHAYSTIRHHAIMLLSSTPQPVIWKHSFSISFNIHSPMKRKHSLLQYTRNNDTQVSELGQSGPSCYTPPHNRGGVLWFLFGRPCVCLSGRRSVDRSTVHLSIFRFRMIASKDQWMFTKLSMCIDILAIWFWIANGQIS